MKILKLIVGMSGASGAVLGIRFLEECAKLNIETHLVMTKWAKRTIELETDITAAAAFALADAVYGNDDLSAPIASGSFRHDGMVIIPCSMKAVAAIAGGISTGLLERAADVALKEGRRLLLVPRETPLSAIHLENLLKLARLGVAVMPPVPAFYSRPATVDDIVGNFVGRVFDRLDIENTLASRWAGGECREF